jgi:hypothetical protein
MTTIDPTAVKAGDTVTLSADETSTRGPVKDIQYAGGGEWDVWIANHAHPFRTGRIGLWAVTAHQPAPKPEWKPGTTGTATLNNLVGGNAAVGMRVMRFSNDGGGFVTETGLSVLDSATTYSVSDFVPDEDRPLPTREERAQVVDLLIAFSNDRADEWDTADKILALLRGESR